MRVGTLKELNVNPRDVVECVNHHYTLPDAFIPGKHYTVDQDGGFTSEYGSILTGNCAVWRIVSRASDDTHKLWRDMTDAEKGALLLAYHHGKVIEIRNGYFWTDTNPTWADYCAYRVKPDEPVRETFTHEKWVSMHEGSSRGSFSLLYGPARPEDDVKGQTTIETVDGKPVKVVWEADDLS